MSSRSAPARASRSHARLLQSRTLASDTIDKLKLYENPDFAGKPKKGENLFPIPQTRSSAKARPEVLQKVSVSAERAYAARRRQLQQPQSRSSPPSPERPLRRLHRDDRPEEILGLGAGHRVPEHPDRGAPDRDRRAGKGAQPVRLRKGYPAAFHSRGADRGPDRGGQQRLDGRDARPGQQAQPLQPAQVGPAGRDPQRAGGQPHPASPGAIHHAQPRIRHPAGHGQAGVPGDAAPEIGARRGHGSPPERDPEPHPDRLQRIPGRSQQGAIPAGLY